MWREPSWAQMCTLCRPVRSLEMAETSALVKMGDEPSLYQLADKELQFHNRPHIQLKKHVVAALF